MAILDTPKVKIPKKGRLRKDGLYLDGEKLPYAITEDAAVQKSGDVTLVTVTFIVDGPVAVD